MLIQKKSGRQQAGDINESIRHEHADFLYNAGNHSVIRKLQTFECMKFERKVIHNLPSYARIPMALLQKLEYRESWKEKISGLEVHFPYDNFKLVIQQAVLFAGLVISQILSSGQPQSRGMLIL